MSIPDIEIRPVRAEDAPRLEEIRALAFAPIFASFRSILGDELYALAQEREEGNQKRYLASLVHRELGWETYVAVTADGIVGFVSVKLDNETSIGEIGLNAVDPAHGNRGIGTAMYEFATARMKDSGMRVATVSTGGDPSHAPARRAYRKAGFSAGIPSVWMCRLL